MTKETWKDFRTEVYLRRLNPGSSEGPYNIKEMLWQGAWTHHTKVWWRAVKFIEKLLENGISLDDIDINDFESAWPCRVYVGNRSYIRLAPNDYKLALKYLKGRIQS